MITEFIGSLVEAGLQGLQGLRRRRSLTAQCFQRNSKNVTRLLCNPADCCAIPSDYAVTGYRREGLRIPGYAASLVLQGFPGGVTPVTRVTRKKTMFRENMRGDQ